MEFIVIISKLIELKNIWEQKITARNYVERRISKYTKDNMNSAKQYTHLNALFIPFMKMQSHFNSKQIFLNPKKWKIYLKKSICVFKNDILQRNFNISVAKNMIFCKLFSYYT